MLDKVCNPVFLPRFIARTDIDPDADRRRSDTWNFLGDYPQTAVENSLFIYRILFNRHTLLNPSIGFSAIPFKQGLSRQSDLAFGIDGDDLDLDLVAKTQIIFDLRDMRVIDL